MVHAAPISLAPNVKDHVKIQYNMSNNDNP